MATPSDSLDSVIADHLASSLPSITTRPRQRTLPYRAASNPRRLFTDSSCNGVPELFSRYLPCALRTNVSSMLGRAALIGPPMGNEMGRLEPDAILLRNITDVIRGNQGDFLHCFGKEEQPGKSR